MDNQITNNTNNTINEQSLSWFEQQKAQTQYSLDLPEEAREQAREEFLAEGKTEAAHDTAVRMLKDNVSPELISKWTGLSAEEIQSLREN